MQWGPNLSFLEKQVDRGDEVPALEERPMLVPWLELPWKAFLDLHRHRPTGWGASPLPLESIVAWMDLHGVDDRAQMFELISALDAEWLEVVRKKEQQNDNARGSD
jgi:hypothetical protein